MSRFKLLAAGCWLLSGAAAAAQPLTEQEALARMRVEHPRVEALRLAVRESEAEARLRTVRANPTVGYTREDTGFTADDFLLVSQELPLWGRRRLQRELADRQIAGAQAGADAALLAVETSLRLAFTDLLIAQERLAAFETGVRELQALVAVLRTREEFGEGSRFDRLRVEREVADAEADLAVARIGRRLAQAHLAAFIGPGADPETLSAAGRLADHRVLPDVSAPLEQRADYRSLTVDEERWTTERRVAEQRRLPDVTLTGGIKRADSFGAGDTGYALAAAVSVPLFSRGQAQVARAEAGKARVEAERRALAVRIASDVDAAHVAATRYRRVADQYRADSVERAADLVTIAVTAYEEGEYGILELLDAYRVTLRAQLRLLDLSAAARRAAIDLGRAVGGETAP